LLGQHGSGKGTLGQQFERTEGYTFISAGDLLRRDAVRRGEEDIASRLAVGQDASEDLTYSLLRESMAQAGPRSVVLDGFPRYARQIELLRRSIDGDPDLAVVLEAPTELLIHRIQTRLVCSGCRAVYGQAVPPAIPGLCDVCGSELIRRPEDTNIGSMIDRQTVWAREGSAILDALADLTRVIRVDASKSPGEVRQAVRAAIANP
jgi:adenylate kinase